MRHLSVLVRRLGSDGVVETITYLDAFCVLEMKFLMFDSVYCIPTLCALLHCFIFLFRISTLTFLINNSIAIILLIKNVSIMVIVIRNL